MNARPTIKKHLNGNSHHMDITVSEMNFDHPVSPGVSGIPEASSPGSGHDKEKGSDVAI